MSRLYDIDRKMENMNQYKVVVGGEDVYTGERLVQNCSECIHNVYPARVTSNEVYFICNECNTVVLETMLSHKRLFRVEDD